MKYPLRETIGQPDLLVGREKEFGIFNKWLKGIPKMLSKSKVILCRKKGGKTSFVQRIFNQLWSENGEVIPFYLNIPESKMWYPLFAIEYFRTFASQYISFFERDENLVRKPLTLEEIKEYGQTKSIKPLIDDVDAIFQNGDLGFHDLIWRTAYTAPHSYAALFDQRILVILDEFQNINEYIYRDQNCDKALDKTLAGSFHEYSESKIAPMLVTGSYVGWLINVIDTYLEAGRLKRYRMSPYLPEEEGLQAVYKYAEVYEEPITNQIASQINELCQSDPFFISCVIQSSYEERDLMTQEGVVNTVYYELSDRNSEMSMAWEEYIELTLKRVNDINAKSILLHLSKYPDKDWTPKELKEVLKLDLSLNEIHERLKILAKSDVIMEGISNIDYRGLQDGTLYLMLRNRFEKEINSFVPDLKKDFHEELETLRRKNRSLQGMLNQLSGRFAEYQLANDFRTRKRFALSVYFEGVEDKSELNIIDSRTSVKFQRPDGKGMEVDVSAESGCGRVVLVEVKKTKEKTGLRPVEDFQEKVDVYSGLYPAKKILPCFLALGGFSEEALIFCRNRCIGTAEKIDYFEKEWNVH
ncbi:MAG: hypothetical protein BA862_05485 [Desulfobulbaceae bacterium S3730MH12]|nr:MAG: hypothetical protein BA862_05485 [Desulfobulbaceae bacterium S3730MH12]OEU79989.1 MAG: hypothetical protein BA873_12505 [Desulfobulbaceae bacterium C00003063]